MREVALALVTGVLVGGLFQLLRLPIPAPPVLAGVAGVAGVWLGASVVTFIMNKFNG
jgi:XapX domain-containing protein